MRRSRPLTLVLAVLAALLLAACSADSGADSAAEVPTAARDAEGGELGFGGADQDSETDGEARDEAPAEGQAPLPASPVGAPGERLIKEGTVTVEVAEGGFERAYRRVVEEARRLGGSVVGSTSTTMEDGGTAGSVTVRVPVDRFEDLLVGIGGAGEVLHRDVTTSDVTGEFTDLESRLRHARAQERFYLGLLEEAQGVSDAIAVQQQLDGIQSTIEQIQGRLNLLDDRTSFSTLTVELVEPGTSPLLASSGERPRLAEYWETARDAFVMVVGSIVVVLVALAPLLIPAVLLFLLWRGFAKKERPATVANSDSTPPVGAAAP
jgi:hypothetical protein